MVEGSLVLMFSASGFACCVGTKSAHSLWSYYSATAKKPLPSLPPYKVLWTPPPPVGAVLTGCTLLSLLTLSVVSTGAPYVASSVTYRLPLAESSVNQLGVRPPARRVDVMASCALPLLVVNESE